MQVLLPSGWAPPIGYVNGIAVDAGRIVFIAGQVGWMPSKASSRPRSATTPPDRLRLGQAPRSTSGGPRSNHDGSAARLAN
jgi:hypothetical protein